MEFSCSAHDRYMYIWASLRENLSLGFPTKRVSNQSPQLQRLARILKFTRSKFAYGTFQKANNKGADQTARMRRLVCTCVISNTQKTGFLASRPIFFFNNNCCKDVLVVIPGQTHLLVFGTTY